MLSVPLGYLPGVRRNERRTTLGLGEELPGGGSGGPPQLNLSSFERSLGHGVIVQMWGGAVVCSGKRKARPVQGIHRGRTNTGANRNTPARGGEKNGSVDILEKELVRFGES